MLVDLDSGPMKFVKTMERPGIFVDLNVGDPNNFTLESKLLVVVQNEK